MKFKRGDLVHVEGKKAIRIVTSVRNDQHAMCQLINGLSPMCPPISKLIHYTGPIYEKDGQRFVPSGEFREPKDGEHFYSNSKEKIFKLEQFQGLHPDKHGGTYAPILLPIPELESQVDPFFEGTREITERDLMRVAPPDDKAITVKCRAKCCGTPTFKRGILKAYMNKLGSIDICHTGNQTPFAKIYSSNMAWKVHWFIPKEDIRVVEEVVTKEWDTTSNTTICQKGGRL